MGETGVKPEIPRAHSADEPAPLRPAFAGESAVVWTLWLTYGAFYFCRTNLATAVPGLKLPAAGGGLGLSGNQIGWILASLKISYGLGQLINGQLSERISPRLMLAIGMFGSAALNVLFGFGEGFYFLLFVWAANGFCQSLGWTPCVRVAANWVPVARRGNAIGIIGTGYQVTLGLTYLVAGEAAGLLGWRGALYVPAALLALAGLFMVCFLRDVPERSPRSPGEAIQDPSAGPPRMPLAQGLYWTLYNPALWLLGLSLGLLNACRYGYLDWGLTHLMETHAMPVGKAVLQYFVIALGATAGSFLAGWATDRFFASRRAPVISLLMAVLGIISLAYHSVVLHSATGTMALLVVIGFCIYGPQVLLVGTAPADLAHRGTSAAAAGFVNFMGYMGAACGDVVTGYYSAAEHGGWSRAIYIWASWAFGGALITAVLWNTTSRKVGLFSSRVPKIGGFLALAAAGTAVSRGEQSVILQLATFAAAVCLAGAFVHRLAALPAFVVAGTGLFAVFRSYVERAGDVGWEQNAAMAAYGLSAIACLMVLVDRAGTEREKSACESS